MYNLSLSLSLSIYIYIYIHIDITRTDVLAPSRRCFLGCVSSDVIPRALLACYLRMCIIFPPEEGVQVMMVSGYS